MLELIYPLAAVSIAALVEIDREDSVDAGHFRLSFLEPPFQPIDNRAIHFVGEFLLHPMAAALDIVHLEIGAQRRHPGRHPRWQRAVPFGGDHQAWERQRLDADFRMLA